MRSVEPTIDRARKAWAGLAGAPGGFPDGRGVEVVTSPASRLAPPGWTGIIVLDGATLVTVPDEDLRVLLTRALADVPAEWMTDPGALRTRVRVQGVLGPAFLAYLEPYDFNRVYPDEPVLAIAPGQGDLDGLLAASGQQDARESGLGEVTSRLFVSRVGDEIVAASGYRTWAGSIAHLSVLTAPEHRGAGHAKAAASAAAADALARGLLPQWRAANEPSRRVGEGLGFRGTGSQISVHVTD